MCDGVVVRSEYSSSYGNMIIIKANDGMGFLYAHMRDLSSLSVGDTVQIGDYVGHEGQTGDSQGIHLHLEMQDLSAHDWQYNAPKEVYTNPADFMGIPNVEGISAIYYGQPIPPTPTEELKKSHFKWVLYARKIRNRGVKKNGFRR